MRRLLLLLPLLVGGLLLLPTPTIRAEEKDAVLDDELKLKTAFQKTDGASLVAFLSTRAKGAASTEKMNEMIEALDDKDASKRQKACADLVAIGSPAVPLLRQAARDVDSPESAALAKRCLKVLDEESASITTSAVRLLVARKPTGMAQALLEYLPHAETTEVMDEIKTALSSVAYNKGKPDESLIKALDDTHPVRRATAIQALCSGGIAEPRAKLRKLLTDKMPSVRLRASLALAQANDAKAVSTMIALLGDVTGDQAKEVESFLLDLAGDQAPKVTLGTDEASRTKARDAWAKWWIGTEKAAVLLNEFKTRTLSDADYTKAIGLIEQLGDDAFETRNTAEKSLIALGGTVRALLRNALKDPDLEIRTRAGKCLTAIEKNAKATTPLSVTTARLVALRKPKGAAEAIIAFLPFADDEGLIEELQTALNAVAYANDKASPEVIKGLTDKAPIRRAMSGAALCAGPYTTYLPQLRKLLKDKDNNVRARVALAMATALEKEAMPTLIALVADLPAEKSAEVEEYLLRVARDNKPKGLPEGESNRKKRSDLWEKWWKANEKTVVMAGRDAPDTSRERFINHTVIVYSSNNQVVELDKNGKEKWTLTGLLNPWDAQVLRNGRVLVTEYNGMRVTERDTKGKIHWTYTMNNYPMSAERLPNGNTFIVCRNQLLEVSKAGKVVMTITRNFSDVATARKLPNGQIVVVNYNNRQVERLDKTGKVLSSFQVNQVSYYQNEILKNGNVVIPWTYSNTVKEYDPKGKEVSSWTLTQPVHASKLPNGGLIASLSSWPYKTVEIDKNSKQVSERATNNMYVFRIRKR